MSKATIHVPKMLIKFLKTSTSSNSLKGEESLWTATKHLTKFRL